jgi:hypothetical protein
MLEHHEAAGRRWALDTLRTVADRLERAPRGQIVEALPRVAGAIEALGRDVSLVLPRRRCWATLADWWTARRRAES